ncbi:MAG: M14 family metallopeptidase [Bacteriovoracaceae bacterium]
MKLISILIFIYSSITFAEDVYWVHLKAENKEQRSKIANFIHIDQYLDGKVYSTVNEFDYKNLKKQLPNLLIDSHKIENISNNRAFVGNEDYEFPKGEEKFHTYDETNKLFKDLSQNNPDIAEFITIGETHEKRKINGIRITHEKNRTSQNFIPGILFLGTHHAREHISTEVPIFLAQYLIENYKKSEDIRKLIQSRDIYIIPIVNPDGTLHDIKGRSYKMWRKNRRKIKRTTYGVDLNRNYGFEWNTGGSSSSPRSDVYHGKHPFSEPESLAIKDFVESKSNLRMMLSFHTYSELILYPWGHKHESVGGREEEVFKKMAKQMSKWNGYTPQSSSDLYIASGDTCDWAFGEHGIFCFTFELSPKTYGAGGFYPGAKYIDIVNQANLKPMLYLIDKTMDPYQVID